MAKLDNPQEKNDHLLNAHACFDEESLSLSGKWRFLCLNQGNLPEGWETPDFNDKKWTRIPVPCALDNAGISDFERNSTTLYRKSFILSKDLGRRQIVLRFEKVSSQMMLWVNGIYIGKSEHLSTPVEFDITSALRTEKNMICLQIDRTAKDAFTGILGDVSLYSLPYRAITHLQARTLWQEDGTAEVQLDIETRNAKGFTARVALMDGNQVLTYAENRIHEDFTQVTLSARNLSRWCAECPGLYRIAVILWDGVAMYHNREIRIGIRRLEQDGQIVLLNGKKETLFAMEYNPIAPESGIFRTPEQLEQDLTLLKKHHFNGILIRQPAPEMLYRLCDRLGLYLIDRSCAEPDQAQRHTRLYGSHPCVFAWEVATDATDILSIDRFSILSDPSDEQFGRILGQNTLSSDSGVFLKRRSDRNSEQPETEIELPLLLQIQQIPNGLDTRIPLIRSSDHVIGVIFSGKEQFFTPERQDTPMMREFGALLQPVRFAFEDGNLSVTNLSQYRSTADCTCLTQLTRDGELLLSREYDLSVAPGETGSVFIETQYDIFKAGRYHLNAILKEPESGFILGTGQWEVAHLRHIFDENPGGTIREDQGTILLRSRDSAYTVNRSAGVLEQISAGDHPLLSGPLINVYSRSQNTGAGFLRSDEWEKLSSGRKKLKPSVFEVDHMTRSVSASFKVGSGLIQTCRLYSDGSMAYELRLRTGRTAPDILGVSIPVIPALCHFKWFGLGPDDVLPGHCTGRVFGIYETEISADPTEGFKESVYNLTATSDNGSGLIIRSEEGMRVFVDGNTLYLMLPAEEFKPHTTYTFGFTILPVY